MDIEWLDTLPVHDPFAAQAQVLQWLKDFTAEGDSPSQRQLEALLRVGDCCAANTEALAARYINTPSLTYEDEDRLWEAVYGYFFHFSRAFQALVSTSVKNQEPLQSKLPLMVAYALHYLGRKAKWNYLRYQQVPAGEWLHLHGLYQHAEQSGFTGQSVKLSVTGQETTCTAAYLQALMLDSLSRTDMTKKEIDLVDGWLDEWVHPITLEQQYEEEWQLFFVDLSADRGGRRIRNFEPTPNCRYWDTDSVVRIVERARAELHHGTRPAWIDPDDDGVDYLRLFYHLLAEWSRETYKRQRRSEDRGAVKKVAEAIHGIFGVCQHVKNVMFARRSDIGSLSKEMSELGEQDTRWIIENESPHGFGATVNPEVDTWLQVGRLIALDYEKNKDMTVVGVVRNINQQPDGRSYVGIEALSHTPTYVLLRAAESDGVSVETLPTSALSFEGMPSFPALYLPRSDGRNIPPSLIIPVIEFVAAGIFEMRMENHPYLVRFGSTMEDKDDWVRVEVKEVKQAK